MAAAGRNIVVRRAAVAAVLGVFVLGGAGSAAAHDGGTDANGCHAGPEPYHCHTSSTSGAANTEVPPTTVVLPVQTSAPVVEPDAVVPAPVPDAAVAAEVAGVTAEQAAANPELAYTGAMEWLIGAVAGILLVLGFAFRSYGSDLATTANIRRHDRRRADVVAFRRRIDEIKARQSGW